MVENKQQMSELIGPRSLNRIRYLLALAFIAASFIAKSTITPLEFFTYIGATIVFLLATTFSEILRIKGRLTSVFTHIHIVMDILVMSAPIWLFTLQSAARAASVWANPVLLFLPMIGLVGSATVISRRYWAWILFLIIVASLTLSVFFAYKSGAHFGSPGGNANAVNPAFIPVVTLWYACVTYIVANLYKIQSLQRKVIEDEKTEVLENSQNLKNANERITGTADSIESFFSELAGFVEHLDEQMQDQSASMEEMSATMEELASTSQKATEFVSHQYSLIKEILDQMNTLDSSLTEIDESSKALAEDIEQLGQTGKETSSAADSLKQVMTGIEESFTKVHEVTEIMAEIADRTNLLALNASIEAARAGDQGRGFAVVAQEVSKLADMSVQNSRNIAEIIEDSRQSVHNGSDAAKLVTGHVKTQTESFAKAVSFFEKLQSRLQTQRDQASMFSAAIRQLNGMSVEIETLAKEQSQGIEAVNKSLAEREQASTELASRSGELKDKMKTIETLAQELKGETSE